MFGCTSLNLSLYTAIARAQLIISQNFDETSRRAVAELLGTITLCIVWAAEAEQVRSSDEEFTVSAPETRGSVESRECAGGARSTRSREDTRLTENQHMTRLAPFSRHLDTHWLEK